MEHLFQLIVTAQKRLDIDTKLKGVKSAIVTFDKNPANYFSSEPTFNIQTFKDRQIILNSLGVDYLYELDFEQFKELDAYDYLVNVLINFCIISPYIF